MGKIYLDNASATPVSKKVLRAMKPFWRKISGNPSSIHSAGVAAEQAVEAARKVVADFLNAHTREIVFTSGGTEANNLAILGLINAVRKESKKYADIHLIATDIEHSSVLECFKEIESRGAKVAYLKAGENGLVNPKDLRDMMRPETVLVSIGYANGEIGAVQPVKEIIKEIRHARKAFGRERVAHPYLHLDASQAAQYLNMNVEELGADLITLDAQKIYGPKGVGALYVRDGVKISPIIFGGGQENGLRSGTENVPLLAGFAEALRQAGEMKEKESARLSKMRDEFFDGVEKFVPSAVVNGPSGAERLPNNINISVPGEDGEMLVLRLDERGFVVSSGSACASDEDESAVIRAIAGRSGAGEADIASRAASALRITLGRETRPRHLRRLLSALREILGA